MICSASPGKSKSLRAIEANFLPADFQFVHDLGAALASRGVRVSMLPVDPAPNPFPMEFTVDEEGYRALVHVRRLTPQRGVGTDHNRGADEWHAQMIFDNSTRGRGIRNTLRGRRGYRTVLLGYVRFPDAFILVGWDVQKRVEYAYSRSLQVREATIQRARTFGISQQTSRGEEIVVAFRAEFFPEYVAGAPELHRELEPAEMRSEEDVPVDFFGPRDRRVLSGTRPIRDIRFKNFISAKYQACAVCGVEAAILLQAAHIIGVSEASGSDHPSNGLRLCRNCHAMYDAGDLLIRSDYLIELPKLDRLGVHTAQLYRQVHGTFLRLPRIRRDYLPDPEKLAAVYKRWC